MDVLILKNLSKYIKMSYQLNLNKIRKAKTIKFKV